MPGATRKGPPREVGSVKKRMQKREFDKSREWVRVLDDISELGEDLGSTKAVAAGVTPKGEDYIWCLVRGRKVADGGRPQVFAVDGLCRSCQFPLLNSAVSSDASSLTCSLCGTKYSLEDGAVLDFLPKSNPLQWMTALANEKKGPEKMAVLPTRVSESGKVYLRLPDGTLTSRLPSSS